MKLPTLEQLQHVTSLLWKEDFLQLDDMRKLKVIEIAQNGILAEVLDGIPLELGIQTAETIATMPFGKMVTVLEAVVTQLEEVDKSIGPIMEWFEKSRLYEP